MNNTTTLKSELAHATGGGDQYKHFLGGRFTQGIKSLADGAGAHWLTDVVFSHQRGRVRLEGFQVWKIRKLAASAKNAAVVTCDDGNGNVIKRQNIPYTDFPFNDLGKEFKMYLVGGVLMLPQEY